MTSVVHGTHTAHHVEGVTLTRPRGMAMVGFLTLITGAWAGIVAFVGPIWGYHASGTQSWVWNANHWLLHLIPGAVGVVAGLLMMAQASRRGTLRASFLLSGLLAAAAGAWLVLGPEVWPMVYSGPVYGPATSHLTSFLNALGANLGPGILLVLFGGMGLKPVIGDKHVEVPAGRATGAPVAAGAGPVAGERPVGSEAAMAGGQPVAGERPVGSEAAMAGGQPVAGERTVGSELTGRRSLFGLRRRRPPKAGATPPQATAGDASQEMPGGGPQP